jgi:predicted nucleotide-binding protein
LQLCAIINISADEERKLADSTFSINENVMIESGAAYLCYDKRIILLADKRIVDKLPSNIKGLYRLTYEGDQLSWDIGMRLQRALTEFREKL